jgi:hypothetical protein
MVEKKRRDVPNGAANFVELTETANTVESRVVQVECGVHSGSLAMSGHEQMHKGHDASPILVASDV